jgi:hypothetical protein
MAQLDIAAATASHIPLLPHAPLTAVGRPKHHTRNYLLLLTAAAAAAAAAAAGSWVLRVADVTSVGAAADAASSPITLTGWSLTICFTQAPVPAVAASQGGDDSEVASDDETMRSAEMTNGTMTTNMTMGNMTASGNGTSGQVTCSCMQPHGL